MSLWTLGYKKTLTSLPMLSLSHSLSEGSQLAYRKAAQERAP